jgi:RNA polymerase sigma-70 factor (sigma-E family)
VTHDDDFAQYMTARWRTVVRSAVLLGCSEHEAEDLAQVTFIRCYARWERVSRADRRDAYVARMLLNGFRDSRRRRWWRERPTEHLPETGVEDRASAHADTDAVDRALGRLTQPLREVVVLRYYTRLSERDTAEALGIAAGTVKSRLSRALSQLAEDADIAELTNGHRP